METPILFLLDYKHISLFLNATNSKFLPIIQSNIFSKFREANLKIFLFVFRTFGKPYSE